MRVLFSAQDPGGTNALIPIFKKIYKNHQVQFFGAEHAIDILKKNRLPYLDCTALIKKTIEKKFTDFRPQVVVVGTSSRSDSIEKIATSWAKGRGIATISIIDSWSNYALRFSSAADNQDLKYLTDVVCVVDSRMKRECVAEGLPPQMIKITGSPYLYESLGKIKIKGEKKQVLFLSQPLSLPPYNRFPFDEYTIMRDLLNYRHLDKLGKIIIKPHPKEDKKRFAKLASSSNSIAVADKGKDVYKLISSARLIIGMNSITLLEAALAGKSVISYQPGISKNDDVLNRGNIKNIHSVYRVKDLYNLLDTYLAVNKMRSKPLKQKSADPVAAIIKLFKIKK